MIERVIINQNKYFREINIKNYIEKNSLKIKEKYLEIIRVLSNIEINNKKLKEHYIYLDKHSLWEMSLIREKNPLKSNGLYKSIKFLACKEILNEFRELNNEICTHNKTYYSLDIGKDKCVKCKKIIQFKEIKK